nr:immunoglobulin light chain junction region [Macaca mulatta]MOW35183.1 immunoglobulin light chain junction region [Macaca mulatta]MOW35300.1 immunoglobulin light chain junction region [Macaca mulatta]
CQQHNDYPYTF